MQNFLLLFRLSIMAVCMSGMSARALILATNTYVGPTNLVYDGTDLVVSNCTVTMDGFHSFNSILIASNGVLSPSFFPSGKIPVTFNVTNEPQVMSVTNPVTLDNTNLVSPVTIASPSGTNFYISGVDYFLTNLPNGEAQIYLLPGSAITNGETDLVSYAWSEVFQAGLNLAISNDITVNFGGVISGSGCGFGPQTGPGAGTNSVATYFSGSGGGGFADGGNDRDDALGGIGSGSLSGSANLGSGGGNSYDGPGGNGGGSVYLSAGQVCQINGTVMADGSDAATNGSGGGGGGAIQITASVLSGSGVIHGNGGAGNNDEGGGGGGGRVVLACATNTFSGTLSAMGGAGWASGGAGAVFTQTNGQVGLLVVDNGGQTNSSVTPWASSADASVLVRNGAVLQLGSISIPGNFTVASNGLVLGVARVPLMLSVHGNFDVQPGGMFALDGQGDPRDTSVGSGFAYTLDGGSHGGSGGYSSYFYDSQFEPTNLGSGGNDNTYIGTNKGGSGGGALQLSVDGVFQVDGILSANGTQGYGNAGGGAGGSIYVTNCTLITGAGSIEANGGAVDASGEGGGGGGGRIAVYAVSNSFTGTMTAYGGAGTMAGGAGTIFTLVGSAQELLVDNGGQTGANTPISTGPSAALVVQNGGVAVSESPLSFTSVLINSNGWMAPNPGSVLNLAASNIIVRSGGGFNGEALGFPSGKGNGAGSSYSLSQPTFTIVCGSGAGYGGTGGNCVSNLALGGVDRVDTAFNPATSVAGSGGGGVLNFQDSGGPGGGAFQIAVSGQMTLDGVINASGGDGILTSVLPYSPYSAGGGGAGGGVVLTVGTLFGQGVITANGGDGIAGLSGGGGGGRIAIYCATNAFEGNLTAFGGGGVNAGGAGTIFVQSDASTNGQLAVENSGGNGGTTFLKPLTNVDLTVQAGALCCLSGFNQVGQITVQSNAVLLLSNGLPSSVYINAQNFIIQQGAHVSGDMAGGPGINVGPYYKSPIYLGYAGAHMGVAGGPIYPSGDPGPGIPNDGILSPGTGGTGLAPYSFGGSGGGFAAITVENELRVDGVLSVNGANGTGMGGGGGAGGGLQLDCAILSGSGLVSANGGNGVAGVSGGGSGGLIAITCPSNFFAGTEMAYGGSGVGSDGTGVGYGGAGLITLTTNGQPTLAIIDNGGNPGAETPIWGINPGSSVIIRNGGKGFYDMMWSGAYFFTPMLSNVEVCSNSILYTGDYPLTITGDLIIHAGALLNGDGRETAAPVSGATPMPPNSGGGYGGWGGSGGLLAANASAASNLGGSSFGSSALPTRGGSAGDGAVGNFSPFVLGGGGGFISIIVNGTLELDGDLTANGAYGNPPTGGGGSGGGVNLQVGSLVGSGIITANGGSGANGLGGGGGGGRIAIYSGGFSNFTGSISAVGGAGYVQGGAGTIYTKLNSQSTGQLLLDNGGVQGAPTTFDLLPDPAVIQNGAIGILPPAAVWSPASLVIHSNSFLGGQPSISVSSINAGSLTVDAGAAISWDGAGYQNGGIGFASNPMYGASHGGYGGGNSSTLGLAYDSVLFPTNAGSAGGSSTTRITPGGGALQLSVSGLLTINGRLSADGISMGTNLPEVGGGAGGSLLLSGIGQLAGSGIISAKGGDADSASSGIGGGGGGRIAIYCSSNAFNGQITAGGGAGQWPGGAGTVYTLYGQDTPTLRVDNGGETGGKTPLSTTFGMTNAMFDLDITGGAGVVSLSPLPLLRDFNLQTNCTLAPSQSLSNLVLAVKQNAIVNGSLVADGLGYALSNGPASGGSVGGEGGGGGHGGTGGGSGSGALGGGVYGSGTEPVEFGSGGGNGTATTNNGSSGGGVIRLSVAGALSLNGSISAGGQQALQIGCGGGAGGSIWVTAGSIQGSGTLSATGGDGANGGGGGGGGRIAVYSATNLFTGLALLSGGLGYQDGQSGSYDTDGITYDFSANSQTPTGVVSQVVEAVNVGFDDAVDPASLNPGAFALATPSGILSGSNLTVSLVGATVIQVSFPPQNLNGTYTLSFTAALTNLFGMPLAQAYSGSFQISLPSLAGTVTDTNGSPVAGVLIQPAGLEGEMTDANGNYSIGVPIGWKGTLTPSKGAEMFLPASLTETNVTNSLTGLNFEMVPTIGPSLSAGLDNANQLAVNWMAFQGVTYQIYSSTNLVFWQPYGAPVVGSNGLMQIPLPTTNAPAMYFRIGASQ